MSIFKVQPPGTMPYFIVAHDEMEAREKFRRSFIWYNDLDRYTIERLGWFIT